VRVKEWEKETKKENKVKIKMVGLKHYRYSQQREHKSKKPTYIIHEYPCAHRRIKYM